MRLEGFPKLAVNIILKDWREYHRPILGIAACIILAGSLTMTFSPRSTDFVKGTLMGVVLGGAYGFAQSCFFNERQRGTLTLLLSLPVTPMRLVWAKYVSAFSMTLFAVNIPGLFFFDLRFQLYSNVAALLLTTVCMAATVISDKPWAPQLPLWIVMIAAIPVPRLVPRYAPHLPEKLGSLASHGPILAGVALAVIPGLIYVSARIFEKKTSA
jgi:ABC-type Na+ efflux pump permease subunit